MALLEVRNLTKRFGGITAVLGLSFEVEERQIVGLIGPNGAGKTTAFNIIAGAFPPTEGEVRLQGRPISGLSADAVARLGVMRTFQNIRLFKELTVEENILASGFQKFRTGLIAGVLGAASARAEMAALRRRAHELMEELGIAELASAKAFGLPYGHQRRVEIARALAADPTLLLLDEPTAGMNPQETTEVMELIRKLRDRGITILVIEHDMRLVMEVCDRVVVLQYGEKVAEGTPSEVRANPRVIEAYLGSGGTYA